MSKAFAIVLKAIGILPVVVEVVAEIEATRDPASPGGIKATPGEVAAVIASGAKKVAEALAKAFGAGA
jgi:hypothetical protein